MRTLSIAVPSFDDVKASAVQAKDDIVFLAQGIAADPKGCAIATGKALSKPPFVTGVCVGLLSALFIKNMVS